MANINEILARAAALRDETALNSISPERAGGIMYDTLIALNELWLQQGAALVISKIYATVAAMEADTSPVSDLTGKPLRPGQIVVIASSDSDNGVIYRYNGSSSPSWTAVGQMGNAEPIDSLNSDSIVQPLSAHQGKVLYGKITDLLPKLNISASQLVRGSLYNGFLDDSVHDCLTTSIYYRVTPGSVIFYSARHNNQNQTCRYSFYTKDKVFLSMYGYTSLPCVVPENAYFCRVSFSFGDDILPTDISDYELMVSACYDWTFLKGNNGAALALTIGQGKLNFDNNNKRVIVKGGNIAFIRDYERVTLAENTSISYGTEIRQTSNYAVYLVVNKDNSLAWMNPSDKNDFDAFKNCIVLASIMVSTTNDVISVGQVYFCATAYQIDGEDSAAISSSVPAMYPVHSYQLKQGNKYADYIDSSDLKSVAMPDKYPVKNASRIFVKVSKQNFKDYRVCFYDENLSNIENTDYGESSYTAVPSGAYYFSLSVRFTVNTTPSDIKDGDITISQYIDDEWGINSGARLALPVTLGFLNFDNVNKVVRVVGNDIAFAYNNTVIYLSPNTTASFSGLNPNSGRLYYLVLDENNQLKFEILNTNTSVWNILHKYKIIASIAIDEAQTIKRENIKFSSVPFKVDNDIEFDSSIIENYCALFNSQNAIDSFLFFTDPHLFDDGLWYDNGIGLLDTNKYIQAIKLYYDATPTSLCICGGDWYQHFDNEDKAVECLGYIDGYMNKHFKGFVPIVGNHDYNKTTDQEVKLKTQCLVNLWYREKGKAYFYKDNKGCDSRFYFFDSGTEMDAVQMGSYEWEQVGWFANKLMDNIGHNVLFIHIAKYYGSVYSEICQNITKIAQAYNAKTSITLNGYTYDFSGCTGTVHCVIGGHVHEDQELTLNGIPIILTANLQYSGKPTFDLCAIDYVAQKLNMVRVGAGSSRIIEIV